MKHDFFFRLRRGSLLVLAALVLAGCTGIPRGLTPVEGFELRRYEGRWFEIMRLDHGFERGLSEVTATYSVQADGRVRVLNRGYDDKRCRWREIEGSATFLGDPRTGSLGVTFFPPFAGGYHVIALDREGYQWAMVSGPTRGYLWILARAPELEPQVLERLVREARSLDFPVDELIRVAHGGRGCG